MNGGKLEVTALAVYPVKSMKGIALDRAVLTPLGLEHDRRFMVIRDDGRFVTQRDLPRLALVETALEADGVTLSRDGYGRVFVPFEIGGGERLRTRVWKDECEVVDQGDVVSRWLTEALESAGRLKLVAMADGFVRPQGKAAQLGAVTRTLFADAAPFLVTSDASLARLNEALDLKGHDAVPMDRFRPNIVIGGPDAFGEHDMAGLAGNGYALRFAHPCERCVVTTIDQDSAVKHPGWEPYRSLQDLNPVPGSDRKPAFGHNASLAGGAGRTIRVGDLLRISG